MPAFLSAVNSVASLLSFLEYVIPRFTKEQSSVINSYGVFRLTYGVESFGDVRGFLSSSP